MSAGRDAMDEEFLAGVDVGGSSIAVLITDSNLRVLGRCAMPTRKGDPDDAGRQVADAVHRACQEAGLDPGRLAAIGVGVPGRVDPGDGTVTLALNLGWARVPLRRDVEVLLDVPCSVENDVRAAARGLVERSVLGPVANLVYISVGTGISAGVVVDSSLHAGVRNLAGEIGHIVIDARGDACVCGLRGCLETVATGPAVAARAAAAMEQGRMSSLSGTDPLTAADVYSAAQSGDALALEVVEAAGRALALVIYHLALTLDVERICLGGGVSQAGLPFLDPIQRELDRFRRSSELAADVLPTDLVHLLPPGSEAGAWGAVLLARKGRTSRSVRDQERKGVSERSLPSPLTT
jgi:glucokinase